MKMKWINLQYVHMFICDELLVCVHGVSHRAISTHVHVSGLSACEVKLLVACTSHLSDYIIPTSFNYCRSLIEVGTTIGCIWLRIS